MLTNFRSQEAGQFAVNTGSNQSKIHNLNNNGVQLVDISGGKENKKEHLKANIIG
jgi:hypothetical protein